jgi:exopolysaccharide biosynthesis polyprenyl glycosylphosphotransferase
MRHSTTPSGRSLTPPKDGVTAVPAEALSREDAGRREGERLFKYEELLEAGPAALSRRDSIRRRLLALADVAALAVAFGVTGFTVPSGGGFEYHTGIALPFWVVLNKILGLYDRDPNVIDKSTIYELGRIAESLLIGIGLLLFLAPVLGLEVHRRDGAEFFVVAALLTVSLRPLVRWTIRRGFGPERTLIVGSGPEASFVARKFRAHPEYGMEVVGMVDLAAQERRRRGPGGRGGQRDDEPPLLGDLTRFEELQREFAVERVVVAFTRHSPQDVMNAIRAARMLGVKLTLVPRLFEVLGRGMEIDDVEGMSVLSLRSLPRTRSSLLLKRAMDVVGASAGLILLSPLLLAIAIAVKATSRGPVFFAQERIGRRNRPFRIYKFRTMVENAEEMKPQLAHLNEVEPPMFKISEDPRLTRVGRLLRRTSLDEIPQLWNVLRGQMSLVGPRPLVPSEDAKVIGWHRARLELTPGLTGPWQVMGRNEIPFREMIELDYFYVADWSLSNDILLLLRTIPALARRRGQ